MVKKSKKLIIFLIIIIVTSAFITIPAYAAPTIPEDDMEVLIRGTTSGTAFSDDAADSMFARVIATIIRVFQVATSGIALLAVIVSAIRYFVVSSVKETKEEKGLIRNSLILAVFVFAFDGFIEILYLAFIN